MSFDKNPADVAMEVLLDEPAPTPLATAQDLLDWVAADITLGKQQRINQLSAIRWLGKVDHTPLAAIPLDAAHLLNVRYKAIRREKSLKDKLMAAAVAHELLLATMVRLKNLAFANLKTNFWPAKPMPDGTWSFRLKAETVKNHKDLKFKLSKHTTRLIQFYLKKCRPLLMTSTTDDLFPDLNDEDQRGRPRLSYLVTSTIRRRLDLDVNAHLYRHIGGFLYLEARPDGIETVRIMLGHKHLETTRKFYARLRETKAMQLFMQVVFGKRDGMIDKLKLSWGKKK